jgi:hypothetical protein
MYVCGGVCEPYWPLNGIYSYSILTSLSVMGRCPVDMNIAASQMGSLQVSSKEKTEIFWYSAQKILIKFQ